MDSRWSICTSDAGRSGYRKPKPEHGTGPGARPAARVLTPIELITKIAVPKRLRYFLQREANGLCTPVSRLSLRKA